MNPTIVGRRPSRRFPANTGTPQAGSSQRQSALTGTLSLEPPLHVAAGTIEIEEDDTTINCCDFGCDDCSPEPTTVWRR